MIRIGPASNAAGTESGMTPAPPPPPASAGAGAGQEGVLELDVVVNPPAVTSLECAAGLPMAGFSIVAQAEAEFETGLDWEWLREEAEEEEEQNEGSESGAEAAATAAAGATAAEVGEGAGAAKKGQKKKKKKMGQGQASGSRGGCGWLVGLWWGVRCTTAGKGVSLASVNALAVSGGPRGHGRGEAERRWRRCNRGGCWSKSTALFSARCQRPTPRTRVAVTSLSPLAFVHAPPLVVSRLCVCDRPSVAGWRICSSTVRC